jgi:REP element-mobilizing transposase RayT
MLHHVMSHGNGQARIFTEDSEYEHFLDILGRTAARFGVRCRGYCLMSTHVHLLIEPRDHPLWRFMQQLNSSYCQWFNRRHQQVGHVLQGRYKCLLVDSDVYLLRLVRYVLRNPIAAGLVKDPADWPWSSYRATVGLAPRPEFLDVRPVWRAFDAEDAATVEHQLQAFLTDMSEDEVWEQCLVIGTAAFTRRLAPALRPHQDNVDFRCAERFAARPSLDELLAGAELDHDLDRAMRQAFYQFAYTLKEIGGLLGRPPATIWSRIHRSALPEGGRNGCDAGFFRKSRSDPGQPAEGAP